MSFRPMLVALLVTATAMSAQAQFTVTGGGGPVPASGTGGGGNPTTTLPASFNLFPLSMPVPSSAGTIDSVTIQGFTHSYSGDIQAVLWAPGSTTGYNLIVRAGLGAPTTCCGYSASYSGNYTFVAAGDPSIDQSWPSTSPATTIPAGVYPQEFGTLWGTGWVSGSSNVFNTDLASIPVVPGIWTLGLYDGAVIDSGSISGWRMSGGMGSSVFCAGDGTATPCPCGNDGLPGNGCASTVSPGGGHLSSSGAGSISADSLVLIGTDMPNSSALYFQGTSQLSGGNGLVFGDGLRCVSGTILRLGAELNAGGTSQYPGGGDAPISQKGMNSAGNVRDYQVWYRNAAPFCTPSTFNLTNGLELTWSP